MFANLSLNAIELLLEHSYLLNSVKIELHLVFPEAFDLEVSQQQHDEISEKCINPDVFLNSLQLFRSFSLIAFDVSS